MGKKRGKPKIVNSPCPGCGADAMTCRCTQRRGLFVFRYYRCQKCGRRDVLVESAFRKWWKGGGK